MSTICSPLVGYYTIKPLEYVLINFFFLNHFSIGYPVVTLGFGFKSYVGYRIRQRKQREVAKENEFYMQLLQQALPKDEQSTILTQDDSLTQQPKQITDQCHSDSILPKDSCPSSPSMASVTLLSSIQQDSVHSNYNNHSKNAQNTSNNHKSFNLSTIASPISNGNVMTHSPATSTPNGIGYNHNGGNSTQQKYNRKSLDKDSRSDINTSSNSMKDLNNSSSNYKNHTSSYHQTSLNNSKETNKLSTSSGTATAALSSNAGASSFTTMLNDNTSSTSSTSLFSSLSTNSKERNTGDKELNNSNYSGSGGGVGGGNRNNKEHSDKDKQTNCYDYQNQNQVSSKSLDNNCKTTSVQSGNKHHSNSSGTDVFSSKHSNNVNATADTDSNSSHGGGKDKGNKAHSNGGVLNYDMEVNNQSHDTAVEPNEKGRGMYLKNYILYCISLDLHLQYKNKHFL